MKNFCLLKRCLATLVLASSLFSFAGTAPAAWESPVLSGLNAAAATKAEGKSFVVTIPGDKLPSFVVITELKLPDHWHAYWINPATVGIPMSASMVPVEGYSVSGPYWSVPKRGESDLGVFYGDERPRVAFILSPKNGEKSTEFITNLSWQMCRDGECMPPEEQSFKTSLSTEPASPDSTSKGIRGIVGIDIPTWSKDLKLSASIEGNTITLELEFPEGAITKSAIPSFHFFSQAGEVMPTAAQKIEKTGKHSYSMKLQRNINEDSLYPNRQLEEGEPIPLMTNLEGVLALDGQGIHIDIPVSSTTPLPPHSENRSPIEVAPLSELLSIAMGLFLGGLILNLMPCVFPVIGLKILSFVKLGGGERRKVFSHSLAFVTGVIISFWIITVILIGVKSGLSVDGQQITWAFWMEKPYVILGLILVMLMMSLSMYGVFEIGVTATSAGGDLQRKEGYAGSFWSGVLATVVATPCTAPFLSGAMPPALALPSWGMFIVFTCMGLGMSLPYIILGAFPHLVKYLPKPGAWMESLKQGISFILLAAVGWLFWVYIVHFEDPMDLFNAILGLIAVCAACWVYGRWCPIYRSMKSRIIGGIIALLMFGTGTWYALPPSEKTPSSHQNQKKLDNSSWGTWSPQAVKEALEKGTPVYVDFTARWCATCQTNKKIAYTPAIMELFKKYGIVLLKADKTRPDPEIDAAMAQLGRASVPLNVLYLGPNGTPHITREILTSEYLERFLNQLLSPKQ